MCNIQEIWSKKKKKDAGNLVVIVYKKYTGKMAVII